MLLDVEVLLVDSRPDNAELLAKILADPGCRITQLSNGAAAMAAAMESPPGLILLDMHMPGVDSIEICRQLKASDHTRNTPILFLIPAENSDAKARAYAAGATDFITTPFQAAEVLARVTPYLALSRERAERQRIETMLQEKTHHLGERVKELNCLYGIASLVEQPNISLPEILQGTVNLIPPAWQYPEITCARIVLNSEKYKTDNFSPTPWQQTSIIIVHGQPVGTLEVGYLEERPVSDEGPFLKEEKNLVDAIAERLGRVVERKRAEKELRENEHLLRQLAGYFPNSYFSIIEKDLTVGFTGGQEFTKRNLDPAQFVGLSMEQVFGEHTPLVKENYLRAFGGQTVEFELFVDNQYQLYQAVPLPDEDGHINRILAVVRNDTERKEAQREIQESEEFFRMISEQMTDMVFVTDAQGVIVYTSPAVESIFGLKPIEMQGHRFTRFLAETEIAVAVEAFTNAISDGTPARNLQFLMKRKDGSTFWGELNATFFQRDGQTGTIGLIRDITELRRAEETLRAREEEYRLLVQNQSDLVVKIDREGRFEFVSPSYCSLFGKTEAELLGHSFVPLIHEDDRAATLKAMEDLYQPPYHAQMEQRAMTKDGWRWLQWVDTAILNEAGDVTAIIGAGRDITERKRAEESLTLLNQAVEQSPVMVVITNADGIIRYVNPKFSQVTGYSAAEAVGQNPRILKSGHHPSDYYRELWDTITGGQEWRGEFYNRKKNGKLYWELASIVGVKDQNGKITHYVAVKEDITQRKKLEEQHVRQERLAAVGQLAAGIAHDFNNILTSIIGFADLLQDQPNADPSLKRIVEQGQRAAELTRQILDFSRQTVNQPKPLDMRIYLNETLKFIERTIPETIQIRFNFERGNHTVNADPTQLQQVITNLAVNARDAMPDGGTLYFDLLTTSLTPDDTPPCSEMETGEWVRLAVTDTGSGIAPEVLPHIFEPFYTTKHVGQGAGLGLAQIYGIVMQHNGCITVNSRVGQGTTFTLYFPALEALGSEEQEPVKVVPKGQGETILLVEDEEAVRQVIEAMLETLNYRVLTANNGAEALDICRAQSDEISLVLTDVVMPGIDGHTLALALQADVPDLPVLLISGYGRKAKTAPQTAKNIITQLYKPLNITQLAQALHEALKN